MPSRNKSRFHLVALIIWSIFPVNTFGGTVTPTSDGKIKGTDSSPSHVSATEFSSVPSPSRSRPVEKEEPKLSRAVRDLLTDPPQNPYDLMTQLTDMSPENQTSLKQFVREAIEKGSSDSQRIESLRLIEALLEHSKDLRDSEKFPDDKLEELKKGLVEDTENEKLSDSQRANARAGIQAVQLEIQRRDFERNGVLAWAKAHGGIKTVGDRGNKITAEDGTTMFIPTEPSNDQNLNAALISLGAWNALRLGVTQGLPHLFREMGKASLWGGASATVQETGKLGDALWRGEIDSWNKVREFGKDAVANIGMGAGMAALLGPGVRSGSMAYQGLAVTKFTADSLAYSSQAFSEGRYLTGAAGVAATLGLDTYLLGRATSRSQPSSARNTGTTQNTFGPGSAVPDSPQVTRPPAGVEVLPDGSITVGATRGGPPPEAINVGAGRAPEGATTRLAAAGEFPAGSVTTTTAIEQPFAPDPFVPVGVLRGSARSLNHGPGWEKASLIETVKRVAGDRPNVTEEAGKTIFTNPETGRRVVYDRGGDYFRVQDPSNTSSRNYLDPEGNPVNPNKKTVKADGRVVESGKSKDEYQRESHYRNDDSGAQTRKLLEESRPIAREEIPGGGREISSPPVARQPLQATVQNIDPHSATGDLPPVTRTPAGVNSSSDGRTITVGGGRSSHTDTVFVGAEAGPQGVSTRLVATAEFPSGSVRATNLAQPRPNYVPPSASPIGRTSFETPSGFWIGDADGRINSHNLRSQLSQVENRWEWKKLGILIVEPAGPEHRGWNVSDIDATVAKPFRVRTGLRDAALDQPATAYYREDGSSVVINDMNGRIVEINRSNPNHNWEGYSELPGTYPQRQNPPTTSNSIDPTVPVFVPFSWGRAPKTPGFDLPANYFENLRSAGYEVTPDFDRGGFIVHVPGSQRLLRYVHWDSVDANPRALGAWDAAENKFFQPGTQRLHYSLNEPYKGSLFGVGKEGRRLISEPIWDRYAEGRYLFVDPVIEVNHEFGGIVKGRWDAPVMVADQPSLYEQPFAPDPFIPVEQVKSLNSGRKRK